MSENRYVPVKGHAGLVRDKQSGAILNVDRTAIEQARIQKQLRKQKEQEDLELKMRLSKLEDNVCEMKDTLDLLRDALIKKL